MSIRTVSGPYMVAILLDLKTEGIPRHRSASLRWVGSGSVKFGLRFGFADSKSQDQDQAKTPLEPMCDRSLCNLLGVTNLRPRYFSPHSRRSPCAGCATGASVNVNGLRVTCLMRRARCLLFESECIVGDVSCGVTGIFEPRPLTRLSAESGTCGLRDFFNTHSLSIKLSDDKSKVK
jgi:hypothetical protein